MQQVVSLIVDRIPCPPEALLKEALEASKDAETHAAFLDRIEAFGAIEKGGRPKRRERRGRLRVAAFNTERLAAIDPVAALLERESIDVALLCEVDLGMARSGNEHNVREVSASLGMDYIFGAEFAELDLGDEGEMRRHRGQRNACGLHGNAIVSSFAIEEAHLIRLETGGLWFGGIDGAQHRIGGRIALAARIAAPHPLWLVSTHLESKTDPADRQGQVRVLLNTLADLIGNAPCIIGGDFNTKALPGGGRLEQALRAPENDEPLFADLREAGFAWQASNLATATQRDGPRKKHDRPLRKLDWIFMRGVEASNPRVIPAVDGKGSPVSDHEVIAVEVRSKQR